MIVVDIDPERADQVAESIRASGGLASSRVVDVSKRQDVAALIKEASEEFGPLNVMVNNAGIRGQGWTDMINVNLSGVAYGIRYAASSMAQTGGGSIISTSSVAGLFGLGYPIGSGADAYVAAKHGVVGLTREYALSYGVYGVRVNCVCPGTVETEMMRDQLEDERFRRRLISQTALRRTGTAQEIANVFLFLASEESSFMTGSVVTVDGGMTAGLSPDLPDESA